MAVPVGAAAGVMVMIFTAVILAWTPAYADDVEPWVEVRRDSLADLLAKSAELDAVKAERAALLAVVAAQQRQIEAQAALLKTQDDMLARQQRLTALADEERGILEGRAERVSSQACGEIRKARAIGYAGAGLAIGTTAFPGPGTLMGAAAGAALGFLLPCP
jgi:hypothetical protein